jgi:hypothetical protein
VAFTKLAEGLATAETLEAVLWAVAHEALGTMQLEDCIIYLVDHERRVCVQAAAYGPKNPAGTTILAPIEIPFDRGIVGRVVRTAAPALVPDVHADPDYLTDDATRNAELAVPIIADGEVIGVIDSEHSETGFFTTRHQTVFMAIARLAAPRIEQFLLKARLEASGDARLQAQVRRLERRYAREQTARREAERLLETKSRELYDLNEALKGRATGLEARLEATVSETARMRAVYEEVLDRLPFQLGIFDVDGTYQYINPAAIADPETRRWIIGRTNAEYGARRGLPPEVVAERDAQITKVATSGITLEFDESFTTKQGELRYFRRTVAPIRDASGQVVRLIGAGLDVTEMKRVEAQLRQSQKMEAIGLLAGGVAHDFNNLLTIVSGVAEVLRGELAANPAQAAMVEELLTAARRGSDLTRQLMAFGRRTIVEPRVFELAEGVRQSAPLVRRLLGDRVELVLDLPDGLGLVRMDPGGLDQVLFNLASNARDAMPDGGVLAIRADRVTLDAAAAERAVLPAGTYLQLEVADTGTGMTAEVQQRVFEPFFTTKATGHGTGLGLATVFGIVAQSGGSIRVRSLVGTGTTFTILFPVVEAAARRISRPDSVGAELPRGGERILVAEDEDGVRKLVCRLLKGLGYQVLEASRGQQALALAEAADRIDLLLTDVRMPDLSGPELADRLQAARPGLRVLFMSGYVDDPELRQRLASGSAAVLDKPFTTQQLAERVRAVLEPAAPSA